MAEEKNGRVNFADVLKVMGITVTILGMFAIQVINADVRNRERDTAQDEKISTLQASIVEVKTQLSYIEKTQDNIHKEQREGFTEIKNMIKNM